MNSKLVYIMAEVAAAQARIEGMKALNEHRQNIGAGQAYGEEAFFREADLLQRLASEAINLV